MIRSSSVRVATANLHNLFDNGDDDLHSLRRRQQVALLRSLNADVLAVQEVVAADQDPHVKTRMATRRFATLADALGMQCRFAVGNHDHHVGLLWANGITPVIGGWFPIAGMSFWHALALLELDVGAARPVVHGAVHLTPFGRNRRADEGERILVAMTRAGGRPTLIAGDYNSYSAARTLPPHTHFPHSGPHPWRGPLYDPDPPQQHWHAGLASYCEVTVDEQGHRSWRADRRPTEHLAHAGMVDTAAACGTTWTPTVGYWSIEHPTARLDQIWASPDLTAALTHHATINAPRATTLGVLDPATLADHYIVVTDYIPSLLAH